MKNYEAMLENINNMSEIEILHFYRDVFIDYDNLRDEEINFLGNNPNENMWSDEVIQEYKELVESITELYKIIKQINTHIGYM